MKTLFYTFLTILLLTPMHTFADGEESGKRFTLSGYIKDASNGEALIGATVYIKDLNSGSVANMYGFYSVSLMPGSYTLEYSYIGFTTQSIRFELNRNITQNIELEAETRSLEEVVIKAEKANANISRNEMSMNKMEIKTIRKIPALMGEVDVIKAIQLLPGVLPTSEGSSSYTVRGGGYDQNLILLDEATVYNASHLMGFFSVFNNDAIKDVKLYKGDIPAANGGRLSSLLDVRMKDGNNQEFEGTGGIGSVSSRLTLEGPIVKGKSSFVASGRRTYLDVFTPLSPREEIKDNKLYFYDFNGKMNYTLNDNNRLFLSGYFGRDIFKNSFASMGFGNKTLTTRWNHLFSSQLFSNITLLYSDYDYEIGMSTTEAADFIWKYNMKEVGGKIDFTWYLNPENTVRFGLQSAWHELNPGTVSSEGLFPTYSLPANYSLEHALYLSNEQILTPRFSVKYGVRWALFQNLGDATVYRISNEYVVGDSIVYGKGDVYNTYSGFEPRIGLKYEISPVSSIKASYSKTQQFYQLASNSTAGTPLDLWFSSSPNVKPQIANQVAGGYFHDFFGHKLQTSVELYYKTMDNTIDLRDHASMFLNRKLEGELRFGSSMAYGAEFMVQKPEGKVTGWISYTLSHTERTIEGINEGKAYVAPYDKPHSVNIILNYELSKKISIGSTWVYATGSPATFPTGRAQYGNVIYPIYSSRNAYRLPDYHRLDLSVTYKPKQKAKRLWEGEWNLSVYNAYARKNAWAIKFVPDKENPDVTYAEKIYLFSIVPSITYNFKF